MSKSSTNSPAEDGDWADFDVRQSARDTIFAIESGDDDHIDQLRLIRIEECIAAGWPRRWLLWSRLRREIRASAAAFDDRYIPRGDFRGRRLEWAGQQSMRLRADGRARQAEGDARTAQQQPPAEGGADPGEGYLP